MVRGDHPVFRLAISGAQRDALFHALHGGRGVVSGAEASSSQLCQDPWEPDSGTSAAGRLYRLVGRFDFRIPETCGSDAGSQRHPELTA